jgi:GTP-binding protein
MTSTSKIRNIAIVAHIDHGKTTLLDSLLKQAHIFRDNQVLTERMMDSFDQEQERGITIFAKHTSIPFEDYKFNIVDTPGHADFSCEVERILGMVSSVLLLVDAQEGPMPQTRFVLSKSLKMGLCPLVVVNKIDKPFANPHKALDLTFDLFTELGASDKQLDFSYCFASGLSGFAIRHLEDPKKDMRPLLELIVEKVAPPSGSENSPFLFQTSSIFYDDYVGRKACGRILEGTIHTGDSVMHSMKNGEKKRATIVKIEGHRGLEKIELKEASAGDIILLTGMPEITIGDTLSDPQHIVQLPPLEVGEPTVSIDITVNSSPFAGRVGKYVTMNKIKERLEREKRANISLKIDFSSKDQETVTVAGRGELHLAVLLETMRREGYELSVSKPRVLTKEENGVLLEPIERAVIEVPEEFSGATIEELSKRKGELVHLHITDEKMTCLEFLIPTRGLMGYRSDFLTKTRGLGILTSTFDSYAPHKGAIPSRFQGVMISISSGQATPYAAFQLQDRGSLFVNPGEQVYEGMIIGEHCRDNDLTVNITKEKHLTNVRAAGSDENIILTPPRRFILEQAISYISDDELVEITPKSIRMRKRLLSEIDRRRSGRN